MRDGPRHRNRLGDLADPTLIATLTDWLEASGACELEIQAADGQSLVLVLGKPVNIDKREIEAVTIKSPLAGHFFVQADLASGSAVDADDILGLIEIGPLRLPVSAPARGVLRDIHGRNGQLSGYGAPLFTLERTA
ncbi:biotin/lipoyl-containing protein [Rhizobium sp. SL42]|uniref:biotin/lipoyl-containing protein n=1 Tax=Rhizobium sp. SL42 TaxID=2806346 RepID=UPI001F2DA893|nr:biotin/lipoyl-containing protein [Rhizobium sp. SL42]UJW74219.1 hypothetical protein IM739_15295 [Rhizobium sp. SL42]